MKRFTNTPRFEIEEMKTKVNTYNEHFKNEITKTQKKENEMSVTIRTITKTTAKQMHHDYKNGMDCSQIADKYNQLGWVTRRQRPFDAKAASHVIRTMARNIKYNKKPIKVPAQQETNQSLINLVLNNKGINKNTKLELLAVLIK